MQAVALLSVALGALHLWPAVVGGPQRQRFAVLDKNWPTRLSKVQNFAWQNCGPSSDPAVLKDLSVSPDPLQIPGTLTVSVSGSTTIGLESPLKMERREEPMRAGRAAQLPLAVSSHMTARAGLSSRNYLWEAVELCFQWERYVVASQQVALILEKRLGELWLKIPCMDDIGSCTYDDGCAMLDKILPPGVPCPEPLQTYGLPCHCPFKAGTYNLPPTQFDVPKLDLPSLLTDGDYRLTASLSTGDQHLGCIKIACSLHAEN